MPPPATAPSMFPIEASDRATFPDWTWVISAQDLRSYITACDPPTADLIDAAAGNTAATIGAIAGVLPAGAPLNRIARNAAETERNNQISSGLPVGKLSWAVTAINLTTGTHPAVTTGPIISPITFRDFLTGVDNCSFGNPGQGVPDRVDPDLTPHFYAGRVLAVAIPEDNLHPVTTTP